MLAIRQLGMSWAVECYPNSKLAANAGRDHRPDNTGPCLYLPKATRSDQREQSPSQPNPRYLPIFQLESTWVSGHKWYRFHYCKHQLWALLVSCSKQKVEGIIVCWAAHFSSTSTLGFILTLLVVVDFGSFCIVSGQCISCLLTLYFLFH